MREHAATDSFSFDDEGFWLVGGDFAAPLSELAETSKGGIGLCAVRAAAETTADICEIQEAIRTAMQWHAIRSKINWPITLERMARERRRVTTTKGVQV